MSDDDLRALNWACHRLMGTPHLLRYSTDANAARLLEAEIKRQGNEYPYERALIVIVYGRVVPEYEMGDIDLFPLIRASPSQRARAFVEVFK